MRRIAVVNMKGGVGKTTTAVHVAAGFARNRQRVLLVDADPQGNVGHVFDLHPTRTIRELMLGDATSADVIIRDVRPGLDVVLAAPSAFGLDAQLAGAVQRETILARRLADLTAYDIIVVDTSPSMGLLTYNALLFATEIIVPVGMDSLAIAGMRQTLDGVREIRSLWPGRELNLLAVLPTAANPASLRAGRRRRAGGGCGSRTTTVPGRHPAMHRSYVRGRRASDDLGIRAEEPRRGRLHGLPRVR